MLGMKDPAQLRSRVLGASAGSYVGGVVFDVLHTYRPSFYVTMGLMLLSIACVWIAAPRVARQERQGESV